MIRNRLQTTIGGIVGVIAAMWLNASPLVAQTYTFGIVPQFEARKLARIWGTDYQRNRKAYGATISRL